MATVIIPAPLRKFTNNTARISVAADNVSNVVAELIKNFPDLKKHLLDPEGKIAAFINVFVNSDDIRNLNQGQTEVRENTIISIVPAIAGG